MNFNFSTKLDVTDKAFTIANFPERNSAPCTFCSESGKMLGNDGSTDRCPRCRGTGNIFNINNTFWAVDKENLIIDTIRATLMVNRNDEVFNSPSEEYYFAGYHYARTETEVFKSLEEAQAECDKRNSKGA